MNFRRVFSALTLVLLCLLFTNTSFAKEKSSLFVDADDYRGLEGKMASLKGNVKVIRGTSQLTCEKALVNLATQEVTAEGKVVLMSPDLYIEAKKLQYNFETKTGVVFEGFMQSGNETVEGEIIYKKEGQQYVAESSSYTSCANCPAAWKVSGTKIDATKGSYAFITNPVMKFYGVPVFWLPYMVVPIKEERQSGFLSPGITFNNSNGTTVDLSYFIALDKSSDMTLSGTSFSFRGVSGGVEYRYMVGPNSYGFFRGRYIEDFIYGRDSLYLDSDAGDKELVFQIPRYGFNYFHHLELPNDYVNNLSVNMTRDKHFLRDFPFWMPGYGQAALPNRISLAKNHENTHISIDATYYQDLLKEDPVGDNDNAIHRLPKINYSLLPYKAPGINLWAGVDFDYLNLTRTSKPFDSMTTESSTFQNGDRYRTGQRFTVAPYAYYPINVGKIIDLIPSVKFQESQYQFGYGDQPITSRRFIRTDVKIKTAMSAVFGEEKPDANKYKHVLEPEVAYTTVPWFDQEDHDFFGQGSEFQPRFTSVQPITEFDTLQFDYQDRLTDQNLVSFALVNKITRKKKVDGEWVYREIIRHRLSQTYDLATAYDTTPGVVKQPWGRIQSLLEINLDYFSLLSDLRYHPYENITNSSSSVTFRSDSGDAITFGYSQGYAIKNDPITGLPSVIELSSRTEAATLTILFNSKYLDLYGNIAYNVIQKSYTSYSLRPLIKPPGECWGIGLTFEQNIGENDVRIGFDLQFPLGTNSTGGLFGT